METTAPLVQHLVEHLAKITAEWRELETAYGNAVKGEIRNAQRKSKAKRSEVFYTRQLLHAITGRHHF